MVLSYLPIPECLWLTLQLCHIVTYRVVWGGSRLCRGVFHTLLETNDLNYLGGGMAYYAGTLW